MKLNVKAFALTCGFSWGILVFILAWWFILFGDLSVFSFLNIGEITRGYSPTPLGSIVASFWAFADGLIIGLFFAWVYNYLINYFVNEPKD